MKKNIIPILLAGLCLTSCSSYSKTSTLENSTENYQCKEKITLYSDTFSYEKKVSLKLDESCEENTYGGDVKEVLTISGKGNIYSKNSDTSYYLDMTQISYKISITGAGAANLKQTFLDSTESYAKKLSCSEDDFKKFVNNGKKITLKYDEEDYDRCYLTLKPDEKDACFTLTKVSLIF